MFLFFFFFLFFLKDCGEQGVELGSHSVGYSDHIALSCFCVMFLA